AQRSRPGAALPTIDRDEVDPAVGGGHLLGEVLPEGQVTHRRLDPYGQPGLLGQHLDPVQHAVDVVELRVPRRTGAVAVRADTPDLRDLVTDLGLRQHAAETGLGALAELHLESPHGGRGHERLELLEAERTVLVAATEVGRADLEDEVRTEAVVLGDPALTGVVQDPCCRAAAVQRLHRRSGQRAEAHGRDVDHRLRPEGVPAPTRLNQHLGARKQVVLARVLQAARGDRGERAVLHHGIPLLVLHVVVRTEAEVGVLQLGAGVDEAALVAAEGPLGVVVRNDVLAQLRPDLLQEVARVPDDRERAQDGVPPLEQVVGGQGGEPGRRDSDRLLPRHARHSAAYDGPVSRRVLVLSGPNLAALGSREPEIYGTLTLAELEEQVAAEAEALGLDSSCRQTDDEGELVGWLHEAASSGWDVVLNPAAFTHYSYAVGD